MCATVLFSREVAGFISIIHLMQTLLFGISVFDFFLLLKISFSFVVDILFYNTVDWMSVYTLLFCTFIFLEF